MPEEILITKKETTETQNAFRIVGSAVRKVRLRPDVLLLIVGIADGTGEASYPSVAFFGEETCDAIDTRLEITKESKPRVRIEGYIRAIRRHPQGEGAEPRRMTALVGTKLRLAKTAMEDATNIKGVGKRKAEGENIFTLVGPVDRVSGTRDRVRALTISTEVDGRTLYPRVICLGDRAEFVASNVQPGTVVAVIGYIRTRVSDTSGGGKPESRMALYINDIDILSA